MTRMKESGIEWIGQIPEEWELKPVKYLVSTPVTDGPHETPILYDEGIPFLSAESVKNGILDFNFKRGYISERDHKIFSRKVSPRRNDIFIVKSGATTGNVGIVDTDEIFDIWSPLALIRAEESLANQKFVYFYMLSDAFTKQVQSSWSFGTQQNIGMGVIEKIKITLPPINEQTKIADFLDKKVTQLDKTKSLLEEQIKKLEAYRQSLIYETVTNGLNKTAPMKDSGVDWIGQVPEISSIKKLKNLLATPLQYGANESGVDYDESLPRYIRITDIDTNGILKVDGKQSLGEKEAAPYILEDGDVLFARSGATVGKTFLYKTEFGRSAFAGYLIKANLNQNVVLPEYLYYYTQSPLFNTWKEMTFVQSTIQNIGADKYNVLPVLVYPIDEQKRMISYLDSKTSKLNQLIAIKQKQIANINQQRQTLIYDYVTGKRRV